MENLDKFKVTLPKNLIAINFEDIIDYMVPLILYGSMSSLVNIEDIKLQWIEEIEALPNDDNIEFKNMDHALLHHNRYFDSMLYFKGSEIDIEVLEKLDETLKFQRWEYSKSLFILYFYCMTRGKMDITQPIPRFLVMNYNITINTLTRIKNMLSSFEINSIEHKWIMSVRIRDLDSKVRNRLALGLAGYRYLSVIAENIPNKQNVNASALRARTLICEFVNKGYYWEVHPNLKDTVLVSITKSINKNAMTLMTELYTTELLNDFLRLKKVPIPVIADMSYTQYRTWPDNVFSRLTSLIEMN